MKYYILALGLLISACSDKPKKVVPTINIDSLIQDSIRAQRINDSITERNSRRYFIVRYSFWDDISNKEGSGLVTMWGHEYINNPSFKKYMAKIMKKSQWKVTQPILIENIIEVNEEDFMKFTCENKEDSYNLKIENSLCNEK